MTTNGNGNGSQNPTPQGGDPTTSRAIMPVGRGVPANWQPPKHNWAGGVGGRNTYYGPTPGQAYAIPTEEMSVRPVQPDWDQNQQFRQNMPEQLTGDFGAAADPFIIDGARMLQSWATDLDDTSLMVVAPDFPLVGHNASLRQGIETLYSLGVHDETVITAALVPLTTNFQASFPLGAGPSIGIRIDWFVQMLSYGPFDLNIQTNGWKAGYTALDSGVGAPAGTQPSADRNLVLRARGGINGGSLFIPWAVRFGQGMNYAMHSIARAPQPGEGASVFVAMNNIPSGLVAAFGFNVRLLTAYSPNTALMARIFGTYGT